VLISENRIKNLTGITYESKFKGIQWTCDKNVEMPIKMPSGPGIGSETPITLCYALMK
jgi:acyl-CoA synthetase (AMP-forming)/AMP-acid ligase II